MKEWQGEALQNKNIYVYADGTMGEIILFCRFLNNLGTIAKNVYFKAPQKLVRLLQKSTLNNTTILDASSNLTDLSCAYYARLSSLPALLNSTYQRVNRQPKHYLQTGDIIQASQTVQSLDTHKFNIGIVWRTTSPASVQELPLEKFYSLTHIPNVQLYALQEGITTEERNAAQKAHITVLDVAQGLGDYLEIAHCIEHLDLIIGVDSPIIHLSGALGHKTWVLLPSASSWYWFVVGEKTTEQNNTLPGQQSVWYEHVLKILQTDPTTLNTTFTKLEKNIRTEAKVPLKTELHAKNSTL
jgi:hypothetical protein